MESYLKFRKQLELLIVKEVYHLNSSTVVIKPV